ncbi:MAG: hypothetical protein ABI396_10625, partial [Ktedonobacteraceae bacterium]
FAALRMTALLVVILSAAKNLSAGRPEILRCAQNDNDRERGVDFRVRFLDTRADYPYHVGTRKMVSVAAVSDLEQLEGEIG